MNTDEEPQVMASLFDHKGHEEREECEVPKVTTLIYYRQDATSATNAQRLKKLARACGAIKAKVAVRNPLCASCPLWYDLTAPPDTPWSKPPES